MNGIKALPMYTYIPLSRPESIRILILHPSEDHSAPLLCDLVHDDRNGILLDLEQQRGYEAVSYTWGEPIFSREILCDGGATKLAVTPNVDSLLRHLRKKANVRRLWIDAICLNQANHDEKRIQVGLMGDIYRQARKVHVWLGDGLGLREETRTGIQQTNRNNFSKVIAFFRVLSLDRSQDRTTILQQTVSKFFRTDEELLAQAQVFLHAPWFLRRWTIQEAALNDHTIIRFGSSKILWEKMVNALEVLKTNGNLALDDVAMTALGTALAIRSRRGTMLQLLYQYHQAQCFDPRDRIAALLSVVAASKGVSNIHGRVWPTNTPLQWTVDYGISWAENYQKFAQSAISNGHIVEIFDHLCLFGRLSQKDSLLPSWVPDWSCRRLYNAPQAAEVNYKEPTSFSIAGGLPALSVVLARHANIEYVFNLSGKVNSHSLHELSLHLGTPSNQNRGGSVSHRGQALSNLLWEVMGVPLSKQYENEYQSDKGYPRHQNKRATLESDVRIWLSGKCSRVGLDGNLIEFLKLLLQSHTFFTGRSGVDQSIVYGLASCEMQNGDAVVDFLRSKLQAYQQIRRGTVLRHQDMQGTGFPESATRLVRVVGHCYFTYCGTYGYPDDSASTELFTIV